MTETHLFPPFPITIELGEHPAQQALSWAGVSSIRVAPEPNPGEWQIEDAERKVPQYVIHELVLALYDAWQRRDRQLDDSD